MPVDGKWEETDFAREMLTARLQCGHLNIVCSALHIQSTSEIGILKKENISYQGGKAVSFL